MHILLKCTLCLPFVICVTVIYYMYIINISITYWESPYNPQHLNQTAHKNVRRATSLQKRKFSPSPNSIFFHETSYSGTLNPRQACAVESAAKTNPKWQIHVIILAPLQNPKPLFFNVLSYYKNLHFWQIDLLKYAKNTPVYSLVANGALNRSRYPIYHTSDVLRYLSLYKYGGVYLDLDVIVVKSFNSLAKNWVAMEDRKFLGAGAIAFSRDKVGRKIASAAIREISQTFSEVYFGHNGPSVLVRVFMRICSTQNITLMSAETCGGIEVYKYTMFYPYRCFEFPKYFSSIDIQTKNVYVHHFCNSVSHNLIISKHSLYSKLAQKYCPRIFKSHRSHFSHESIDINVYN